MAKNSTTNKDSQTTEYLNQMRQKLLDKVEKQTNFSYKLENLVTEKQEIEQNPHIPPQAQTSEEISKLKTQIEKIDKRKKQLKERIKNLNTP